MTTPAAAWMSAKRILCVRLDSIGDVLMTTPAIRAVKASGIDREITLLTSPAGASVASLIPCVDEVVVYDAPWLKATNVRVTSAPDHAMIAMLRARQFDAAIIFTVFSQSALPAALACFLADIPLRLAHSRENPYQLLTTWVPEPEPAAGIRHEVERQLSLVDRIGCRVADTRLQLSVPEQARADIRSLLCELGVRDNEPWFVLHPGASAASRRYPPDRFAIAARAVADAQGGHVLVTGDGNESTLIDQVCAQIGDAAIGLAGKLDLASLAALIEASPLLITNNTGPAHIAAAVGTPVVDLYALTNPQHTPWQVPSRVLSHDVPCRNCFKSVCPQGHNDCLRRIAPFEVARAALDLLAERSADVIAGPADAVELRSR